jgi:ABC-type Fe3+ transport system permease subunit
MPVVALLAPAFAFLAAFTYWPVLRVFGDSFMVGRFAGPHALGLDNYRRLFADPHFARAAWNNAEYAVGTIVSSLVLALLFALALRDTNRFTAVLRTFVAMPLMIPLVAAAALFSFILLPGEGLLDYYLAKLGGPAINWLGDTDLALGSVVAITVWKNTGYYMLFFSGRTRRSAAGPVRRGNDRRRRRVAPVSRCHPPNARSDFRLCRADCGAECADTGGSFRDNDAGRASGCYQSAALLHLSAGGAEL